MRGRKGRGLFYLPVGINVILLLSHFKVFIQRDKKQLLINI